MKSFDGRTPTAHDLEIDAALATLGRVEPRSGIESRVNAALAHAQLEPRHARFQWLRRAGVGVLAAAAGCGIVVATLEHSNRTAPLPRVVRSAPEPGVSAAQTTRVPTRSTSSQHELRPGITTHRVHSRAEVQPNQSRHPAGAAVPRSPYPPGTPQPQDAEDQ